jgi:Mrp family chromosome partitioning ATPase
MSIGFLLPDSDVPVIWRGPVKMGVIRQFLEEMHWGNLDCLIIDLPPGTGDESLSVAQLIPNIDGAVIVTTPQDVALLSVRKSIGFAKALSLPVIGIVENMSGFTCPHSSHQIDLFKSGGGLRAAVDMNIPFLGRIPFDLEIVECGDSGIPCLLEPGSSRLREPWENLAKKVEEFVNGVPGVLDNGGQKGQESIG